eukprot:704181-Rhodomonas_salina.3
MRYLSTAHCTAPYAASVPHIAYLNTLSQYHTSHSTMRYLSIAHRIAPCAISVPHITYLHTLSQYRISHTSIRYLSTAYRTDTGHVTTRRGLCCKRQTMRSRLVNYPLRVSAYRHQYWINYAPMRIIIPIGNERAIRAGTDAGVCGC